MKTLTQPRTPAYRHFKPKNLGVVRINGKDFYLGKYDSPESWEKYHRLIAEWHANNHSSHRTPQPDPKSGFIGINCVVEAYLEFARGYYSKEGEVGKEYVGLKYALEPLCDLYGLTNANDFGPKALKNVRQAMIGKSWSRGLINSRVNRIKRCFKWAVAEELVAPSVLHGLQAVPGLRYGRSEARETEPVKPVDDAHIDAVLPFLTPVVAAMVQVQRLTGMRPCEVVLMRPADIDRSGDVWVYELSSHKNQWRGHRRLVPLGPQAQELLMPYLNRLAEAFIFSPRESEGQRNAARRRKRKSPMTPSQAQRLPKKNPMRAKQERYRTDSYRRAISYGIKMANRKIKDDAAKIPAWYPLQIRHTRATEVRRQYGLDGAQSALGHKNADITQIYAEKNHELAKRIAKETG